MKEIYLQNLGPVVIQKIICFSTTKALLLGYELRFQEEDMQDDRWMYFNPKTGKKQDY